ncbi:MAG: hypothetical protein PHP52_08345 [Bacteroidales bacterium]|nr:hypothetical protein [Bacteroidales bacterium]MDD4216993.1 hypothetical protein [Bacteroidales bacterium]MDY0142341.1 hypothetical protein [Bacteroidales bacterium]
MKNKILLIIIVGSICLNALGQVYPAKNDSTFTFYTEIGISASLPQAEFKYYSGGPNTGYAKPGGGIYVSAKAYQNKFLGYCLNLNATINPADNSFYDRTNDTLKADIGMWKNINFSIGPILYANSENILLELKLPIGFNTVSRPEVLVYNYYANSGTINRLYKYTSGHSIGWCVTPEIAMIFKINDNLQLKFFSYYLISNVTLNYQLIYGDPQTSTSPITNAVEHEQKIKIRSINAGITCVIKLNK